MQKFSIAGGFFLTEFCRLASDGFGLKFRIGFHAIPSMRQLHMHVISQDFDSDHLKNKKHWNSFTTNFFVDADFLISKLASKGSVHVCIPS
jgi:aprataxin